MIPCDSNFDLNDNQLGNGSDVVNGKKIRIYFTGLDHFIAEKPYKIGTYDDAFMWPRRYECMGESITIDRDASWSIHDYSRFIYTMLAEKLSAIPGLTARQVDTGTQNNPDSIEFTIDTKINPVFTFVKIAPDGDFDSEVDELRIITQNNTVKITDHWSYPERILDRNKNHLTSVEMDVQLPISKFLYE